MNKVHHFAQHRRSDRLMHWPQEVPRDRRMKLRNIRGFHTCHGELPRDLLRRQHIRLRNHLIIVVEHGCLRIDRAGQRLHIEAGNALLLSNVDFTLSELTAPISGRGVFILFFFEDDLLERVPEPDYRPFLLFHEYGRHLCDEHMMVLPGPMVQLASANAMANGTGYGHFLELLVRAAYIEREPSVLKLIANRIIVPRIKIQLFAESLIFLDSAAFTARLDAYPEGTAVLRREIRRMGLGGIQKVVTGCRRHWRAVWQAKGIDPKRIQQVFYFLRSSKATGRPEAFQEAPKIPQQDHPKTEEIKSAQSNKECASPDVIRDFKVLQCTAIEEALTPTNIIELPGLENWQELLKAA